VRRNETLGMARPARSRRSANMGKYTHHGVTEAAEEFPTETAGLPEARPTELVELSDGDESGMMFSFDVAPTGGD
jgi:hypothetical protein